MFLLLCLKFAFISAVSLIPINVGTAASILTAIFVILLHFDAPASSDLFFHLTFQLSLCVLSYILTSGVSDRLTEAQEWGWTKPTATKINWPQYKAILVTNYGT